VLLNRADQEITAATLFAEINLGVRNRTALCLKIISLSEMEKIFLNPEI
jgi:hypothetical protein